MNLSTLVLLVGFLPLLAIPCSAGYSVQDVRVDPTGESYPPGTALTLSASIPISPSGPTTFIEGHTLVLSTDLVDPGWNVRVIVDGRQAAVFRNYANTLFINGYLLSYPVSREIEVAVRLEGGAPSSGGDPFTVLRVVELNNQGRRVPGSEQSVALNQAPNELAPGAGQGPNPQLESTVTTTASAGSSLAPAFGALILAVLLVIRRPG